MPRAVNLVLIAVLGVYAGISMVAHLSPAGLAHGTLDAARDDLQADPVLGIVSALAPRASRRVACARTSGALAATILLIATNAGMIGSRGCRGRSRSTASSQRSSRACTPPPHALVHDRRFSVLAAILLIPGKTDFLGNLYASARCCRLQQRTASSRCATASRTASVPTGSPWNVRVRGGELPLAAVLGALGTFVAWLSVIALHAEARSVGTAWMVVGLGGYFVYRRRLGLNPRERFHVERRARPVDFHPLEYASALVPLFGSDATAEALEKASKLIGRDAVLDVVVVNRIPPTQDIDAEVPELEARTLSQLDAAHVTARSLGHRKSARTRSAPATSAPPSSNSPSDEAPR